MSTSVKVNLGKTKVNFNEGITKDGLSKSNLYLCAVCIWSVNVNSVLCVQYVK